MRKNKMNDAMSYPIRMERKLHDAYMEYCEKNGLNMSGRIRTFLKKDLEKKVIIEK